MYYNSANRDETHFEDPYRFDVTRPPNAHVRHGAGRPHFCLGANLARREIMMACRERHLQGPDIRTCGAPAMLTSDFIHGIKRLDCEW
jgi:cytochrome P450